MPTNPFIVTSARNESQSSAKGTPLESRGTFVEVLVLDIILNDKHPKWKALGGWDALGTVFYKNITNTNIDYDVKNIYQFRARPFFSNQKYYPLINERVMIFYAITKDVLADRDGVKEVAYYFPNLNIWNHPHHNALPSKLNFSQAKTKKLGEQNPLSQFKKTLSGIIIKQPKEGENSPALGKYFLENSTIKPLLPYEGDYIIEGRFGNSIRFGATTPFENPLLGIKDSIQPIPNSWSERSLNGISKTHPKGKGQVGDPIIIIRNEQPSPRSTWEDPLGNDKRGWVPMTEDINKDGSSIYMTSNQVLPNLIVAGARSKSDALISNQSYGKEAKISQMDLLSQQWDYSTMQVEEFFDEASEFVKDPLEYLAPTPEPQYRLYEFKNSDGDNDFSFTNELLKTGLYDIDDIEEYHIHFEREEVSGTNLSVEEMAAEGDVKVATEIAVGADGQVINYDVKREERSAYIPPSTPEGTVIVENHAQYNQWVDEWKAGKIGYPFVYRHDPKKKYGFDVIVDPQPITKMLERLKNEGVNSTNYPERLFLCLHITATSYQSNHELADEFMYSKKWSRHGYHLSVDDKGDVNYNFDLKAGNSYGVGSTAFSKKEIGGLKINNSNCINISWIGLNEGPVRRPDIAGSARSINNINITAEQAYSFNRLVEYFMDAFPNMIMIGHNQVSVGGGSSRWKTGKGYRTGKSCPCWDVVEYAKHLSDGFYRDRAWQKHFGDYTEAEKKQFNVGDKETLEEQVENGRIRTKNGVLFSNMINYYNDKKYRKAAQYVIILGGGDIMEDNLLEENFA